MNPFTAEVVSEAGRIASACSFRLGGAKVVHKLLGMAAGPPTLSLNQAEAAIDELVATDMAMTHANNLDARIDVEDAL
jgi:hypothetical protein